MDNILSQAIAGFFQQSNIELVAVTLSIAYLLLAMKENIWCWPLAFISTALFSWVFFDVSLIMESLLNIYYMAMAVYGFWSWRYSRGQQKEKLIIQTWTPSRHAAALGGIAVLTVASGYYLMRYTQAALPFLDAFTTWGSVITTYMVARKVYENWWYWLVIDSAALYMYVDRGLYPTAFLMAIYIILVILGIVSWKKKLAQQKHEENSL